MEKGISNNKKALLTSKLNLHLGKILIKCYAWNTASYGAESWTLRKVDQKFLDSFEMWCWRSMEISWTDHVRNEKVLVIHRVKEKRSILEKKRRLTRLDTSGIGTAI
jgi:hypothetical protein